MAPRDNSPDDLDRTLPNDSDRTIPSDPPTRPSGGEPNQAASTTTPTSIGNYTILGKLGEGGMGVVYEAEQQNPKRKVAIKVVRGGQFVDELSVKMFQREAETLGRLKHPGIGAIYESGRTDEGQHFFAMELVRGETLDAYIIRREKPEGLSRKKLRRRLALFRKICDAANYAHQRGVIHRDLKPSNIVINEADEPKILDFGLARLADNDTAGATVVSERGVVKGTLSYMSPEQTTGDSAAVDLRSDVYSLGVLLYEMLTGERPYDVENASLRDALRTILEEPPRPFREVPAASALDADLETICFKALEKDPDRRYANVSGLADDVERFLTLQPILARPPSTLYQISKLVERHRLPTALLVVLILLITVSAVTMSVLYGRQREARARAATEAEKAQQVAEFQREMLASANPSLAKGKDVTVREVLDEAATRISGSLSDQPHVRAAVQRTIGVSYGALGLLDPARSHLEEALMLHESVLVENDHDIAVSLNELGEIYKEAGEFDVALASFSRARSILEREEASLDLAKSIGGIANVLRRKGRFPEARPLYEEMLEIAEQAVGKDHLDVTRLLNDFANLELQSANYAEAERMLTKTLDIKERSLGPDHPDVATALHNLANVYRREGRYESVIELLQRALKIREKYYDADHPALAEIRKSTADCYLNQGKISEAIPVYNRLLPTFEERYGADHPIVAEVLNNSAIAHDLAGDYNGARVRYTRARIIWEGAFGPDHQFVATSWENLAVLDYVEGDLEGARLGLTRSLEIRVKVLGPDHVDVASSLHNLAEVYSEEGKHEEALRMYDRAQRIWEAAFGDVHPDVALNLEATAAVYRKAGRPAEAESAESRAADIRAKLSAAE